MYFVFQPNNPYTTYIIVIYFMGRMYLVDRLQNILQIYIMRCTRSILKNKIENHSPRPKCLISDVHARGPGVGFLVCLTSSPHYRK